MRKVKFIAPARREFLKEVGYYNGKQLGLGARFAEEVEAATARALAYPTQGRRHLGAPSGFWSITFPFPSFTGLVPKALSSLRSPIIRAFPSIGSRVSSRDNKRESVNEVKNDPW